MNKTISGENIIGNPSKRTYGDIDTDYDRWCEDGGKRRATPTLEQKIMLKKREVEKWNKFVVSYPYLAFGVGRLSEAQGELKQLEYELSQRLTPAQLFHMLQTTGISLPKRSQYEAVLKPALEFGLIVRDQHNHYSMAKPTPVVPKIRKVQYSVELLQAIYPKKAETDTKLPFAIGDKVRVKNTARNAFMQTIYTVCKPVVKNGTVWYPLVQDYRKGMIYRKADMLEVVS